ncbi:MAG: hypothetical protein RLO50_06425 [Azospirillaceae bacterium]
MSACQRPAEPVAYTVEVPPGLAVCKAEPERPALADLGSLMAWAAEVALAGRDCRARLAALNRLVAGE